MFQSRSPGLVEGKFAGNTINFPLVVFQSRSPGLVEGKPKRDTTYPRKGSFSPDRRD
ncbi:unknown protein (plasmid) [Synechocystis sp. PCC 6803]|uniref:Uncharacterized protein n=1 Tax=Synechocystis sp. (strain ATCC 27184 / PCC 6803 / Kazusa) TaxID=1111708 RepID=Q6ZEH8_SYNY3|nr:unknown protein [Synechocystis sp. PCC 6803]